MDLTTEDILKIERYASRFRDPSAHKQRVMQILQMSEEDCTIEQIKDSVKYNRPYITEVRAWGRREGLW